ncbi:hypothetical protein AF332_07450 [Sporosarcina globispora]|uniref:Uncharacterized protein n=1 Tax=Sporosarcina globispora TaxID=1459 RepID=A0A0M0GA53_SPOGL|nr:hypothetical protein AF332_07450 [Sporosarcina globispora]
MSLTWWYFGQQRGKPEGEDPNPMFLKTGEEEILTNEFKPSICSGIQRHSFQVNQNLLQKNKTHFQRPFINY